MILKFGSVKHCDNQDDQNLNNTNPNGIQTYN